MNCVTRTLRNYGHVLTNFNSLVTDIATAVNFKTTEFDGCVCIDWPCAMHRHWRLLHFVKAKHVFNNAHLLGDIMAKLALINWFRWRPQYCCCLLDVIILIYRQRFYINSNTGVMDTNFLHLIKCFYSFFWISKVTMLSDKSVFWSSYLS